MGWLFFLWGVFPYVGILKSETSNLRRFMSEVDVSVMKQCRTCSHVLPATLVHFPSNGYPGKFRLDCRKCYSRLHGVMEEKDRENKLTASSLATATGLSRKRIAYDISQGVIVAEKVSSATSRGYYLISQEEATKYAERIKDGSNLYKPRGKPTDELSDDTCSCCSSTVGNILGDVNDDTQEVCGYLCAKCFRLVRDFHADLERMRRVVKYLSRTERTRKMKHSS
jgi:hypothetical protein